MARKRSAPAAVRAASPELGDGDYAVNYTSAGRAIRKCRTLKPQHASQDSEESAEDDEYDDLSDEIAVASSRKRSKRAQSTSPTRELPSDEDLEAGGLSSDDDDSDPQAAQGRSPTRDQQVLAGHLTVNLTVNIPLNHQGIITLSFDPKNLTTVTNQTTDAALARLNARSQSKHKSAGFLDLPAELKNIIYRDVLVADKPMSFRYPGRSFSRTSALLRTCKQVYVCMVSLHLQLQISLIYS